MSLKKALPALLILTSVPALAQNKAPVQEHKTPAPAIEQIVTEARKLDDKLATITVQAKAAALISHYDPIRSDAVFLQIWKFAKEQIENDQDREQAVGLILKHLFPRNPKLAKQLSSEQTKNDDSSLASRATGRDQGINRVARLATQLVDVDPRAASEMLEQTLPRGVTPAALGALTRLRERNALLSDFVVAKAIEGLTGQPDVVALSGLHVLSAYVYPESATAEVSPSLQSLQIQYFSSTYDVLHASLAQRDDLLIRENHYSEADLRLRAMYQARIAIALAALAGRYRPDLVAELEATARKMSGSLPDNVAQLAKITAARLGGNEMASENPETAISIAILKGEFEVARGRVDELKEEKLRTVYSQLIAKAEARSLLAKGEVMPALEVMRKIDDISARLIFYLEAIKVSEGKRDRILSNLVINEARTLVPQVGRNGLHVRALLTFASQLPSLASTDEAIEFLDSAVVGINSLTSNADQDSFTNAGAEYAWGQINDPKNLLDAPEFERAFSVIAALDEDRASSEVMKLQIKSLQLVARLAVIAPAVKNLDRKFRATPPRRSAQSR